FNSVKICKKAIFRSLFLSFKFKKIKKSNIVLLWITSIELLNLNKGCNFEFKNRITCFWWF
ncbi:hypothetical protein ABTP70_19740, partial [Acinetobacter baumannii]